MKRRGLGAGIAALLIATSCAHPVRAPHIPSSGFLMRHHESVTTMGDDTTRVTLAFPEFVATRTPEALDSLNAAVRRLVLASWSANGGAPARDTTQLMQQFEQEWRDERRKVGTPFGWFLDRRVSVSAETLGVVTLRFREYLFTGGAHPLPTTRFVNVEEKSGRTLRFTDLFADSLRDSLSAALVPAFRAARGLGPDSSLGSAGFWFPDGRFRVNDNVGLGPRGVAFYFNAYEVGPYALGPTEVVGDYDAMKPFANPDGPLAKKRRGR